MPSYSFSAAYSSAFSTMGGVQDDMTLLDLLKIYLGIPLDDLDHDEALNRALNFAGDMMERYLDLVIVKREVEEYFPHHFGTVILHNLPVDTSEEITVNLNGYIQSDFSAYLDAGKLAHLSRTNFRQDMPFDWRQYDNVTVTYTSGFDPIPSDLAYAIIAYSAELYAAEGTGQLPSSGSGELKQFQLYDVGQVSYDVGSTDTSGGSFALQSGMIPTKIAEMVSPYKRMTC